MLFQAPVISISEKIVIVKWYVWVWNSQIYDAIFYSNILILMPAVGFFGLSDKFAAASNVYTLSAYFRAIKGQNVWSGKKRWSNQERSIL